MKFLCRETLRLSENGKEMHTDEATPMEAGLIPRPRVCHAVRHERVRGRGASRLYRATDHDGWYVAEGEVAIDQRVTVTGDVNLILKDGCHLIISGGIQVSEENSLTIYG